MPPEVDILEELAQLRAEVASLRSALPSKPDHTDMERAWRPENMRQTLVIHDAMEEAWENGALVGQQVTLVKGPYEGKLAIVQPFPNRIPGHRFILQIAGDTGTYMADGDELALPPTVQTAAAEGVGIRILTNVPLYFSPKEDDYDDTPTDD